MSTIVKDPYSDFAQKNARKSHWYSDIASSVTKCPFCDLKDKYIVAFRGNVVLTMNLFPYVDGHLMVIPRTHVERLADVSSEDWQDMHFLIDLGIRLVKEELQIPDVNVLYREGTAKSGSSLKHLHVHVIPVPKGFLRYENFGFTYAFQDIMVPPLEMAKRLRETVARWNIE